MVCLRVCLHARGPPQRFDCWPGCFAGTTACPPAPILWFPGFELISLAARGRNCLLAGPCWRGSLHPLGCKRCVSSSSQGVRT